MLDDARVSVLLTERPLAAGLPAHTARVSAYADDPAGPDDPGPPRSRVRPDNLA